MIKNLRMFMMALGVSVTLHPSAAQVPALPMLKSEKEISKRLVEAFLTKNVDAYATNLSDNLHVFEDGKLVASNKAEWLKRFGPKLKADGVIFKLSSGFGEQGNLIFMEYFNSAGSWGPVPSHCCWSTDAVSYKFFDGKIVEIRRLTGGSYEVDGTDKMERK